MTPNFTDAEVAAKASPRSCAAMAPTRTIQDLIERWQGVTASELATAQSFVMGLCELLDVPKPHATPAQDYMFERQVSTEQIDWLIEASATTGATSSPP